MSAKIQIRRDTAANWASANPVLLRGEFGFEYDTNKVKIGNGTSAWNSLSYAFLSQALVQELIDVHANRVDNPHAVTKSQVGLENVPNVDATLRSNHTGTQQASTISDFDLAAKAALQAEYGIANGLATLDSSGKVPVAQLPNSVMEYKGAYNPITNSPVLTDGTGNAGDVYRISVDGTRDFGSGSITFFAGDFIIYSGSIWERSPLADGVVSVNGYQGAVVLTKSDVGLGNVPNINATSRANHTGTQLAATISDFTSAVQAVTIDAAKIDGGVVSNTEFAYLDGVTSPIQTQLDGKRGFLGIQTLTGGTTYTPTAGTTYIEAILVGAGGGGGGVTGTNANLGAGAGGGSGAILIISTALPGAASYTYSIGTAGTAGTGTPSATAGGAGGSTTLTIGATTYTANGGSGGAAQTAGTAVAQSAGGAGGTLPVGGSINIPGRPGSNGFRVSGTAGFAGAGAHSSYGAGGAVPTVAGAGNTGIGYGSGGSGGYSTANQARAGGAGSAGVIIIKEYK